MTRLMSFILLRLGVFNSDGDVWLIWSGPITRHRTAMYARSRSRKIAHQLGAGTFGRKKDEEPDQNLCTVGVGLHGSRVGRSH